MAYPEDYDNLTDLDLGECSLFSHVLHDGIIDTADQVELNNQYNVYAKYGSGTPKLAIIDPSNDEILKSEIEAEWLENSAVYKFTVDIPADGTDGEGDTVWEEKGAILKVYSDDSDLVFRKYVHIITKACTQADMCDTLDKAIEKLDNIEATESTQNEEIQTLKNGWKVIV